MKTNNKYGTSGYQDFYGENPTEAQKTNRIIFLITTIFLCCFIIVSAHKNEYDTLIKSAGVFVFSYSYVLIRGIDLAGAVRLRSCLSFGLLLVVMVVSVVYTISAILG